MNLATPSSADQARPLNSSRAFARAFSSFLAAALLAAASFPQLSAQTVAPADADRYIRDIQTLSAPDMEGRGDGSKGLERAREVLAARYKTLGLEPKGTKGFLQPFDVIIGAELTPANSFSITGAGSPQTLKVQQDYIPFAFSSAGSARAAGLVFAGYGITAPEWKFDEYAGLDVKGKIVVVLRKEPAFAKMGPATADGSHHGELITKAILARNHGAAAVIVLNGKLGKGEEDLLPRFGGDGGQEDVGIPIVEVKNDAAAAWFEAAGKKLLDLQDGIDNTGNAASFAFPAALRVSLDTGVKKQHAEVSNVLAYLPGKSDEYVILGAHYDHLGRGEYGSLAPSLIGQFHPGADDNASGTAGLLELARVLAPLKGQLPRGILFASFAGEELGLLGSAAWVRQPTLPLDKAIAMLNMDMIGRIQKDTLYIGGVGTAAGFRSILEQGVAHSGLKAEYSESGYSSSDHTSFVVKQIPVLFFFSGLHSDYHKPSDTWEKIDSRAAAHVVDLVGSTALNIDELAEKPAFITVVEKQATGSRSGGGSGYGPYFGSIPDFGQVETGVRFSDVRPASPAAKAGLKPGDTMIQFGEQPIKNLYDFTDALRRAKVGDVVEVTVLRDGKPLKVPVTLEQRK